MTPATDDHAPLLERAFQLEVREDAYDLEASDGAVPDFIRGSYYLNGPAGMSRGSLRYRNWLDGDGMVCALHFTAGGVRFVNRFVRSTKLKAEEEAGRALYRAFGTNFEDDQLKRGVGLESPVNVSIYAWRGTLLAFGEQGLPWELDPETLETRGEYTYGGRLNAISPISAHPHFDYASDEMFNFGVSFSARHPSVTLFRFGGDGELIFRRRLPLDHPRSMHDFGLAPHHVVFYQSPYLLDVAGLLSQGQTLLESLSWQPELGSKLEVVSRQDGEPVASIDIGSNYCLHLINCWQNGNQLVVDAVELDQPVYDQYDIPELFPEARTSQPRRYVVDLEAAAVVDTIDFDYRKMCDFPAIDPRRATLETRDFWVLGISATELPGRKFFDQLVHLDWRTGRTDIFQAPAGQYLGGEPTFLGDPGSERGAVICQRFDAERGQSAFLIFDAFDVARGPVATLELRSPIHLGFHTSFDPRWNGGYAAPGEG